MKLRDAVYGLAVGDALGVPSEFCGRHSYSIRTMTGGGTHGQPVGTFSDDTSMTIATCDSIRERGCVDTDDMRGRFVEWCRNGEYAIGGRVFDIGATVSEALHSGVGLTGYRDNGNGSLMRMIPFAFLDVTDQEVADASSVTHAHEIAKTACILYVKYAKLLLAGRSPKQALEAFSGQAEPFARLETIHLLGEDGIRSSGYVVDTLEAALWCFVTSTTYRDCVLRAVNLGGDTDTVGAVAGGLAGLLYGYESIPENWIKALRGKVLIEASLF